VIIDRVEMENILSHRATKVEFPRGVVAIVGPNGAGKTSIVDAISFALFGTHSRRTRSNKHIIRLGAPRARVALAFTAGGRRYLVTREVAKNRAAQAALYLLMDGDRKPLATGASSVLREIEKITGMKSDLAQRLYITQQGELDTILTDKQKRLDLLNSLLRLNAIEEAHEILGFIARHLRSRYEDLTAQYETLTHDIAMLEAARRQLADLRRRLEELRTEEANAREALRSAEEKYRKLQEIRERLNKLEREYSNASSRADMLAGMLKEAQSNLREAEEAAARLAEIEETIRRLEGVEDVVELKRRLEERRRLLGEREEARKTLLAEIEKMTDLEAKASRLEEARRRLERLEEEAKRFLELRSKVEHYRDELEKTEASIKELRRGIEAEARQLLGVEAADPAAMDERLLAIMENLERHIERARARKEEIAKKIAALQQRRKEIEDNLDKLTSAAGVCPLCRRPLDEDHRLRLIQELRKEKRRVEAEIQRLIHEHRLVENEVYELEEKKRSVEKLLNRLRGRVERLRLLSRKKEELEAELEEINQEYLSAFTRYKEYEEARRLVRELEHVEKQLVDLRAKKSRLEELEREVGVLQREVSELEARLREAAAELGIGVDEVEKKAQELQGLRLEAARLRERASRLQELRSRVEEIEKQLASLRRLLEEKGAEAEELRRRLSLYQGAEEELEEARRRYQAVREELARAEATIERLEEEVKRLEVLEERAARLRAQVEAYRRAVGAVERLRKALGKDGLQRLIRVKARNVIEHHLRDMLARFNLDFVDVRLGDDYEAILVSRDGEKTVNMLSGGERVSLAIAYRLALARAVGGRLETLVMDEPTIHLDEERKRELIDIIRYGLEATGLKQLIVVTHDQELEEAADYVLEVRKENGVSRVTAREPLAERLEAAPTG